MGFIGVQPATVPLTSSDITDGIITTAKIADDAVGNTKLDLTANYAFTGTITGAGKLGQVLTQTPTSSQTSATSSYVDSGLSINITPASTSSTILVMAVHNAQNSANNTGVHIRCFRDSTQIGGGRSDDLAFWVAGAYNHDGYPVIILDSPNTTSQVTYKTDFKAFNGGTAYLNHNSTMVLQEILG
tara:strand:- start:739 stop:1296 length:558 start_codon:yes stop_codon:yes gene_type:complete